MLPQGTRGCAPDWFTSRDVLAGQNARLCADNGAFSDSDAVADTYLSTKDRAITDHDAS